MTFENINDLNRAAANVLINKLWFGTTMIIRGKEYDISTADGFLAYEGDLPVGIITYLIMPDACEILSLNSIIENKGIATRLIEQLIYFLKLKNCKKLRLITSNDNIKAIAFYQKFGFDLSAFYRNSIDNARIIKPTIPIVGMNGIPIKHELEFEYIIKD